MLEVKTREVCETEIANLVTLAEEGEINPLNVYATLKQLKDLTELAIKQVEPLAKNSSEMYPERTFEHEGFIFEKRTGATRYSFNHIPEIFELKQQLKFAEAKYKHAYLSKEKGLLTASEDGEELVLPKVSYSKDSLIVKKVQ